MCKIQFEGKGIVGYKDHIKKISRLKSSNQLCESIIKSQLKSIQVNPINEGTRNNSKGNCQ